MLIFDFVTIGNKLYEFRKKRGMTQAQIAEAADISDRAYADIERGSVNMRIETMLSICQALHISPDELLTDASESGTPDPSALFARLADLTEKERKTALTLLETYLDSLR